MYPLLRRALFTAEPETAHDLALGSLKLSNALGASALLCKTPQAPVNCMGLEFPNPMGLAAGLDKNGDYIDALGALGFGFIEIGTVTPKPQPGNPKPRLFRLPKAEALINRMGFNNKGVDHLVAQVEKRRFQGILGINIGKNKTTPNEKAVDDYLHCLDRVYPHADYVTINISSPNTKGLRELQSEDQLKQFLHSLNQRREQLATRHDRWLPLAVKVAPDLSLEEINAMSGVIADSGFEAVICSNTTVDHSQVEHLPHGDENGGLSGKPLKPLADQALKAFRRQLPDSITLIGVGGIMSGDDAVEKLSLGADLVQVYTGFIYHGPSLISSAVKQIIKSQAAA